MSVVKGFPVNDTVMKIRTYSEIKRYMFFGKIAYRNQFNSDLLEGNYRQNRI